MALEAHVNGQREKSSGKSGDTLRFELELALPTDESTNEFSYAHLVADALRKQRSIQPEPEAQEEESDEKLAAIARKFEEKYGPRKRKRLIHETDLVDKGYGYDIDDSFVDDSELYEDYVPPHVETQFGGFYVNTGELEFRETDNDDFDFVVKKKPKIRKQPSHTTPKAILASQKVKKAKQHVASQKGPKGAKSIKKLLFSGPGTSPLVKQVSKAGKSSSKPHNVPPSGGGVVGGSLDSLPSSSTTASSLPPSSSSLAPTVPISVGGLSLAVSIFDSDATSATGQSSLTSQAQAAVQKLSLTTEESSTPAVAPKPTPVLPDNLSTDLQTMIRQLEESVAKVQTTEGKLSNKARESCDEQLADIEMSCKSVTLKSRTAVMEYLSPKLGVSRATLFKRAKHVLRKRQGAFLQLPLQKLKEAVDATMLVQEAQYKEEVELRSKARTESTSSLSDKDNKMEVDEDGKTDDAFEDSQPPGSSQQEGKPKRPPRKKKKYKWNDETRRLVCNVVKVKVEGEEVINRISRGNPEELLMEFLEAKVKPIWPSGWMHKSVLYKVSEPAHKHFTNPRLKKVKKEKTNVVKVEPGAAAVPAAVAAVAPPSRPFSTAPISVSSTSSSSLVNPLSQRTQEPRILLTNILQDSGAGKAGGSSGSCVIQSKGTHTSSVATGTGEKMAFAGKKTAQVGEPLLRTPSGQLKHKSTVLVSSSHAPELAKVKSKPSVSSHLLLTQPPQSTVSTSVRLPIATSPSTALTVSDFAKLFPYSQALNGQLNAVYSQIPVTASTVTTTAGVAKLSSIQARPSVVQPPQPLKSSVVHAPSEKVIRHSYGPTSIATTIASSTKLSHRPSPPPASKVPIQAFQLTTKARPQAQGAANLATKTKPIVASATMPMLPAARVPSPSHVQQATPPSSPSTSMAPSPKRTSPSTKSLHRPKSSPKHHHHHHTVTNKGSSSPPSTYQYVGRVSPPSSQHLHSHSPIPSPGGASVRTTPPTTLLQHSSQSRKQTNSQSVSVPRKTTPSPLTLPSASSPTQAASLMLPVIPPMSLTASPASSSPSTPTSVKSPVEQIFEEHSYVTHQGQVFQLSQLQSQQWVLGDARLAQGQLLVTTTPAVTQQKQPGGMAVTMATAGSHQPNILLPVTQAQSGSGPVSDNSTSSSSSSGLLVLNIANSQGNPSAHLHTANPTTGWKPPPQ